MSLLPPIDSIDRLDDDVCIVLDRTTCNDPAVVRACNTSNSFRCDNWVPFGVDTFCESITLKI